MGSRVSQSVHTRTSATHTFVMRRLTLPDLTPNPGLWWYFFTEIFDHFRPFFLMVFSVGLVPSTTDAWRHLIICSKVHLLIYVAPVTFKLQ